MERKTRFGSFCTSVLGTTDPQRAALFYRSLIGWTASGISPDHQFLQHNGKTVASIRRVSSGPDQWVPHVSVEAVDRTIADATAAGATLLDRADDPPIARIATLRDPEGAMFGLWQPATHSGAELMDEVGSLWWVELLTNSPAAASEFYRRLFGWNTRDTAFEPFDLYTVLERGTKQEGGLLKIHDDWDIEPQWTTFISVNDCDATMSAACGLGGQSQFVHTVPKHGRIGSITDNGGARLALRGPVPAAQA